MMKMKRTFSLLFSLALVLTLLLLFPLAPAAHENATPIAADFSEDSLTDGVYRLEADVAYTGTTDLNIKKTVTLCLNGHTLTLPEGVSLLLFSHDSELTLCDCGTHATEGKVIGSVAPGDDSQLPDALIQTASSNSRIIISDADVENTAEGGIGIRAHSFLQLKNSASVTADGYSVLDCSNCSIYLGGECTVSAPIRLMGGLIYAYDLDTRDPYTGGHVEIELSTPDKKTTEGDNSIVQGVTDNNHAKFSLITPVEGYLMVRVNEEYLMLKKQLDDTALKGASATLTDAADGKKTLTIAPLNTAYSFLRQPTVTVDGVAHTPLKQENGSYTVTLTDEEAAKYLQITAVAGLPLEDSKIDATGLIRATVEAVIHDGQLFFTVIPDVGYAANYLTVQLNGNYVSAKNEGDTLIEGTTDGVDYPEGAILTVSGSASEISIFNIDSMGLINSYYTARAGADRAVIVTIFPGATKMFLVPPSVTVDGVPLAEENLVKQEDGTYMATVPGGRDKGTIALSGNAVSVPETQNLFDATVTVALGDSEGEMKLTVTPKAGLEFPNAPTVSSGGTNYPTVKESDGSYTAILPMTATPYVSGQAAERIGTSGTLTGATITAFLYSNVSENLFVRVSPEEGKRFVTLPLLSLNGQLLPASLWGLQEDGSYHAILIFDGGTLEVNGLATEDGHILPSAEALTGAGVTAQPEADGTVTVTVTPEAGKEFATAPTVTVGGAALTLIKQANGSYTGTVSATDIGKPLAASGTATPPPPPVTTAPTTSAPPATTVPPSTTAPVTVPATTAPLTAPATTAPTTVPTQDNEPTDSNGPWGIIAVAAAVSAMAIGAGALVFIKKHKK